MEMQTQDQEKLYKELDKTHRRGKIMGGLLIVAIGSVFLAKELGAQIPSWLFSWKTLLIALGLVTGVKHKFMHPGWLILVLVGGAFLLTDIYPDMQIRPFLWPVFIILVGLFIMFKPHRKHRHKHFGRQQWKKWHEHDRHNFKNRNNPSFCTVDEQDPTEEDYIDSTTCMAGIKKIILSKKFRGGDITNIFGGSEINLMQADLDDKARLEITQVFGGTKLIVPPHWEIKSEIVAILGSVEDKRPVSATVSGEPAKVLVLVGTTVFGGIEIRSY